MSDYDPPDEFDAQPRVTISISSRPRPCRRCDASGVVSDSDGRGVYCPECRGTAVAQARRGGQARFSWGRTKT